MHLFLTGASAGIGAAIARLAVAAGWRVSGCARRPEPLAALAAELGPGFRGLVADVTDQPSLQEAAAKAAEAGPFDAVVANAGRGVDGELLELTANDLAAVYDLNVVGVHRTVLATRPHLAPGARLVLVSSVAAFLPVPRMGAYCATKHALEAYAAALRMETRTAGLRVCTVCPGTVDTDFFTVGPKPGRSWTWRPGRAIRPERVARVVLRQCRRGRPRRAVLPWFAGLAAFLYRTWPALVERVLAAALGRMRAREDVEGR